MNTSDHSCLKVEHYTPWAIAEAARVVMDGIGLDVASNGVGNTIIQADHFFVASDNALSQDWEARSVWCNPPGGVLGKKENGTRSHTCAFFDKLYHHWNRGDINEAIFMGFNLEILAKRGSKILALPFCIPQPNAHECISGMGRIKFLEWDGEYLIPQDAPRHGNVIVYLPDENNTIPKVQAFHAEFSKFGQVNLGDYFYAL